MKNFISGLFFGIVLGFVAGFAAGIFVFPYLFPPPPVNEAVDSAISSEIVATGSFIHAKPSDPVHYGKGRVSVYPNVLHLETDFEVGPGPKFHVYLVPRGSGPAQGLHRESELSDPGRCGPRQVRVCGDLVRAVRRAGFTCNVEVHELDGAARTVPTGE
jgi:hypothetical protein